MRKTKENGITLVALVITIIILLILAGITISQLTGSGLFENARLAQEKSTKAEMAESLTLALQELQLEKRGKATINDITQEWIDNKLSEYKCVITEDAENNSKTITMEKDGITVNYVLDEKLGLTESTVPVAKFKIEVTEPIVSTSTTATESDQPGLLSKGTASYINFTATLDVDVGECKISPELPYKVLGNGTYTFTVTGIYEGETLTKEVKVNVNQYVAPTGYVQYDAGNWTQEEIAELESKSLYDINISKTFNSTFKLKDANGINFTFGGFTYEGDTTNSSAINAGKIATSRNQSISSYHAVTQEYLPKYNGWQILETTTKTDESGNAIKNKDGTNRIYITKLVHAGAPENFVYTCYSNYDPSRMEYLLSSGNRKTSYSTLSTGEKINPRNWDVYRDKELDAMGYIKEVHIMTYDEAKATSTTIINTYAYYWLATADNTTAVRLGCNGGGISSGANASLGIRPVVEMNDGVYIASGEGTAESPYVLGKE